VQSVVVHTKDKLIILLIIHHLFQQLLSSCILVVTNLPWATTRVSQSLDQTTHESYASLPDLHKLK
jgi:hypothetical protein